MFEPDPEPKTPRDSCWGISSPAYIKKTFSQLQRVTTAAPCMKFKVQSLCRIILSDGMNIAIVLWFYGNYLEFRLMRTVFYMFTAVFVCGTAVAGVTVERRSVYPRTQIRVHAFARESEVISNPLNRPQLLDVVPDGAWVNKGDEVMVFDPAVVSNHLENLYLDRAVTEAGLKVSLTGIDNKLLDFRDKLGAAEDKLAVLNAKETRLLSLPDQDEVAISKGNVRVAALELESASNELVRAEDRLDRKMISKAEYQKTVTAYELAKASWVYSDRMLALDSLPASSLDLRLLALDKNNIEIQITKLEEEITENTRIGEIEKRGAYGKVHRIDMRIDEAMQSLTNTVVTAPIDGYIMYLKGFRERTIERGERMWRNFNCMRIPDMTKQAFQGVIMESERPWFSEGDRAWISLPGRMKGTLAARIDSFGSLSHDRGEKSGVDGGRSREYGVKVYDVTLRLDDVSNDLSEAMHGTCELVADNPVTGIMIPLSYVRTKNKRMYAVLDGERLEVTGSVVGAWLLIEDESLLGRSISRFSESDDVDDSKTIADSEVIFSTSGVLTPADTVELTVPDVHGWPKVTWLIPEDTVVTQGMPVVRLDTKDVKENIDQWETLLMEARSSREAKELNIRLAEMARKSALSTASNDLEIAWIDWQTAKHGLDSSNIEMSRYKLAQAEIKHKDAALEFERLQQRSMISSNELFTAERNVSRTRLRKESATISLNELLKGTGSVEVERKRVAYEEKRLGLLTSAHTAARDRYKESIKLVVERGTESYRETGLAERRQTIKNHTITAPGNGLVRYRKIWNGGEISKVREGSQVGEHFTLMDIADVSEMTMRAEVPERYFSQVSQGLPVIVTVPSMGDLRLKGYISEVEYLFEPQKRNDTERGLYSSHEPLGTTVFYIRVSVESIPGVKLKVGSVGEIVVFRSPHDSAEVEEEGERGESSGLDVRDPQPVVKKGSSVASVSEEPSE